MPWSTGAPGSYISTSPVNAALINAIATDLRTWGGNVDAGGYALVNADSLTLNPGAPPSGSTPGTLACDTLYHLQIWNGSSWVAATTAVAAGTWNAGSGVPSSGLGSNGDMYINTANGDVYGPKAGGAWTLNLNIKGPAGTNGTNGTNGAPGVAYTARGAYGAGTTYAQGDEITSAGVIYISLQAANTGNTPASSPTWWQSLAGVGLLDPGANGLVYRSALNTTAVATALQVQTTLGQWVTSGSDISYPTGKVGVGTASPASILQANAPAVNCDSQVKVSAGGIYGLSLLTYNTGLSYLCLGCDLTGGAWIARDITAFRIYQEGGALQISANGSLTAGVGFTPSAKMLIDSAGKVSIGGPNPTSAFQVVGLVTYASDAAAGTAGLTAGAFYKDAAGGLHVKL